jgi:hypothetical protein
MYLRLMIRRQEIRADRHARVRDSVTEMISFHRAQTEKAIGTQVRHRVHVAEMLPTMEANRRKTRIEKKLLIFVARRLTWIMFDLYIGYVE